MSTVDTEHVLVVPAELLHGLGYFQGFMPDPEPYLNELLSASHVSYRPRGEMEADPRFKQLIPYVIFHHVDSEGGESVFQYTRGKGQGEQRLHRKKSVGVGGHIALADAERSSASDPYREGMRRELAEEVRIETDGCQRCVGLINDDLTDVGKVHLGIVHLFQVDRPEVRPKESEIMDAGFHPVKQILSHLDAFETWSQICMRSLFEQDGDATHA